MIMPNVRLMLGNCLEQLKQLPDNSIDAVVTDPPYGLGKEPDPVEVMKAWVEDKEHEVRGGGFMGREWDAFVPQPAIWKEVYRVLKPGGHVVAFFGTRTYDWGVMAMRFAGFEIRDRIQWVFDNSEQREAFLASLTEEQKRELGGLLKNGDNEVFWATGQGFPKSLNISKAITAKQTVGNCHSSSIRKARMGENYAPTGQVDWRKGAQFETPKNYSAQNTETPLTAAAKQWNGFGTALKPANEPIALARKPLEKSLNIAENVLKHGTGGINIDGCRVDYAEKEPNLRTDKGNWIESAKLDKSIWGEGNSERQSPDLQGRFPANLIHSGEKAVVELFPETHARGNVTAKRMQGTAFFGRADTIENGNAGDSGSAARFFYCAKASKKDRNENGQVNNKHVTVKPHALMKYLVRLITPPNGTVLDPFMGSGSTGKAAVVEGFNFVGIELDPEYLKIAEARVNYALSGKVQDEPDDEVEEQLTEPETEPSVVKKSKQIDMFDV